MPTGIVKKFFKEKGFGFITPDDGSPDIFAPARNLVGCDEADVAEGVKVSFESEMETRTNKPRASTWRLLDASALGSPALGGAYGAYGALPTYGIPGAFGAAPTGLGDRYSPYGAAIPAAYGGLPAPAFAFPAHYAPLPASWEQVTDPASGKAYYWNRATGETSWTPPAAPPLPAPVVAPRLPDGWEQAVDPATGKPYFFNRSTGETRWDPPVV